MTRTCLGSAGPASCDDERSSFEGRHSVLYRILMDPAELGCRSTWLGAANTRRRCGRRGRARHGRRHSPSSCLGRRCPCRSWSVGPGAAPSRLFAGARSSARAVLQATVHALCTCTTVNCLHACKHGMNMRPSSTWVCKGASSPVVAVALGAGKHLFSNRYRRLSSLLLATECRSQTVVGLSADDGVTSARRALPSQWRT